MPFILAANDAARRPRTRRREKSEGAAPWHKSGWRRQWQARNLKRGESEKSYARYCLALMYSEAIELGATRGGLNWDLGHGYLKIFLDSLRVELPADTAGGGGEELRAE